jgi:hypothetical protein
MVEEIAQALGRGEHPLPYRHLGNTWSTRCAALSAMRRVLHEGQISRPLQEILFPNLVFLGSQIVGSFFHARRRTHRTDPYERFFRNSAPKILPSGVGRADQPFTHTTCFKVCTTSTRSRWFSITVSMSL